MGLSERADGTAPTGAFIFDCVLMNHAIHSSSGGVCGMIRARAMVSLENDEWSMVKWRT